MGYDNPDVYHQPEAFGLELLVSHDFAGSYEFDIYAFFRHTDGRFFMGHDSGCSCPSPFENQVDLSALEEVSSLADIGQYFITRGQDTMPITFTEKAVELGLHRF